MLADEKAAAHYMETTELYFVLLCPELKPNIQSTDPSFDLGPLHNILKDGTRRRILLLLRQRQALTYVEMLNLLEITHMGKLNYQLKVLGEIIQKDEGSGKYTLAEKGVVARACRLFVGT
jgi:hypothetical protein